jgi:hypothetical protein
MLLPMLVACFAAMLVPTLLRNAPLCESLREHMLRGERFAYVADAMAGPEAKPIVNWSVVAENIDTVTALARAGWKRFAG